MTPRRIELPYHPDSARRFDLIADRPWALFLDSAAAWGGVGRWDILTADPITTLVTRGQHTEIRDAQGRHCSEADPFRLLRDALGRRLERAGELPFIGGAIGWLGYDLARRIERLPEYAINAEDLPEMAIGIFDWALLVDHQERRSWLVSAGRDAQTVNAWPQLVSLFSGAPSDPEVPTDAAVSTDSDSALPDSADSAATFSQPAQDSAQRPPGLGPETPAPIATDASFRATAQASSPGSQRPPLRPIAPLRSNLSAADYAKAFERVQAYIQAGDCYQVNLAQRFSAPAEGDPWASYCALRKLNPAPYSAYLKTPFASVLCSSPERFLGLRDGQVETRPIKGTRPRSAEPTEDQALLRALADSPKDRAENLMIVDLLRNDLGRVCRPGSIHVPSLFATESFASVHHLVSTIRGTLQQGEDACSLLRACFPGGSITGAPKIRAMEIIEALEPHRRGLYCGTIGYIGFDGAMDSNIAIRTLVYNNGELRFWAGGGLVADSDCDQEYRETLDKAARLFQLLEPH